MTPADPEEIDHLNITSPARVRMPDRIAPMLASTGTEPFDSPDYIFELMWGGLRTAARVDDERVTLLGRNGCDLTAAFPELHSIPERLLARDALLDGEIVAVDAEGHPSFDLLRPRLASISDRDSPVEKKQKREAQLVYQAFDILWLDGRSLVERPLWQRKNRLHEALTPSPSFCAVDFVADEGTAFFDAVLQRKLEGIVAKQKASPYTPGRRSRSWLEIRALQSADFVVGGYTFGAARRKGEPFGQLLLGGYDGGRFDYVGAVSGGLNDAEAKELVRRLEPFLVEAPAFSDPPRIPRLIYWTQPRVVCHVRFSEWSKDGYLRFPIFDALRPDIDAEDCVID